MKAISGIFYNGISAKATPATLRLGANGIVESDPELIPPLTLAQLRIESRVGSIARQVYFPNGAALVSTDHDALDEWSAALHPRANLAHRLESRLAPALTSLVIVLVIMLGGAFWAVPHFAGYISGVFPHSWAVKLGAGTLQAMDNFILEPSDLPASEQERLTAMFETLLPESVPEPAITLRFRRAGIANAFALPDDSVVVTDELVSLLHDDVELSGVLLHEIGHVVHRHNLRMFISHMGLAGLTLTIFGDISSAGSLALGLPNVLLNNSYSRELEWEADSYALELLQHLGLPPASFADALDHLENPPMLRADAAGTPAGECPVNADVRPEDVAVSESPQAEAPGSSAQGDAEESLLQVATEVPEQTSDALERRPQNEGEPAQEREALTGLKTALGQRWMDYLSTHPPSEERKARFRAAGASP